MDWEKILKSRERRKSAPYLRLKKTKGLQNVTYSLLQYPKKNKKLDPFGFFKTSVANSAKNQKSGVTASSGTAISTDFATLTCSEILSKILIRCVTWH